MDVPAAIQSLDRTTLTALARKAAGTDTLEIGDWNIQLITYDATNPVSGGVYRVAGSGNDAGRSVSWSLILKIVQSPEGAEPRPGYWPGVFLPTDGLDSPPMYWKREPLAYQSGLLDDLPAGPAAPRCFAVLEQSPSIYWLWLEEIADAYAGRWTLARYADTARQLGRFNGAYLAGRPLPDHPWLGYRWMRAWLEQIAQQGGMQRIVSAARQQPAVRPAFPRSMAERLVHLWRERELFLAALDRVPQTLCHRDAFPANLFARCSPDGREELLAVDWSFVGIGPVGEEIPSLVAIPPPPEMGGVGPAELQQPVFEGYIQGLREAGWNGDVAVVRLGYAASAALRYSCLTAGVVLLNAIEPNLRAAMEQRHGRPIEEVLKQQAALFSFCLELADEARELMRGLSL